MLFIIIIIITLYKTTYKDIQYTTLLILFALLTTQYYIMFSFTFAHTLNKKKKKQKSMKGKDYLLHCALVTDKNKIEVTKILVLVDLLLNR